MTIKSELQYGIHFAVLLFNLSEQIQKSQRGVKQGGGAKGIVQNIKVKKLIIKR